MGQDGFFTAPASATFSYPSTSGLPSSESPALSRSSSTPTLDSSDSFASISPHTSSISTSSFASPTSDSSSSFGSVSPSSASTSSFPSTPSIEDSQPLTEDHSFSQVIDCGRKDRPKEPHRGRNHPEHSGTSSVSPPDTSELSKSGGNSQVQTDRDAARESQDDILLNYGGPEV